LQGLNLVCFAFDPGRVLYGSYDCRIRHGHNLAGNAIGVSFILIVNGSDGKLGLQCGYPAPDYPALGGKTPRLDQFRYPPIAQRALQLKERKTGTSLTSLIWSVGMRVMLMPGRPLGGFLR
jgi:hypothetical protein